MVFSSFKIIPIYKHPQSPESTKMESRRSSTKDSNQVRNPSKVKHITQSVYYTTEPEPNSVNESDPKREEVPVLNVKTFKKSSQVKNDYNNFKAHDTNVPEPGSTRNERLSGRNVQSGTQYGKEKPKLVFDVNMEEILRRSNTNPTSRSSKTSAQFYRGNPIVPNVNYVESQNIINTKNSHAPTKDEHFTPTVNCSTKDAQFTYRRKSMNSIVTHEDQMEAHRGENENIFLPTREETVYGNLSNQSDLAVSRDPQLYYNTLPDTNTNLPQPSLGNNINSFVELPMPLWNEYLPQQDNLHLDFVAGWPTQSFYSSSLLAKTYKTVTQQGSFEPTRDEVPICGNNENPPERPNSREHQLAYCAAQGTNTSPTKPPQGKNSNSYQTAYPVEPPHSNNVNSYEHDNPMEPQRGNNANLHEPAYPMDPPRCNNVNSYQPTYPVEPLQSNNVNSYYEHDYPMEPERGNNAHLYQPAYLIEPQRGNNVNSYEPATATEHTRGPNINSHQHAYPMEPQQGNKVNPLSYDRAYHTDPTTGNNVNVYETARDEFPFHGNATQQSIWPEARSQQLYYNSHPLDQNTSLPVYPMEPQLGNNPNTYEPTRDDNSHVNNFKPNIQMHVTNNGRYSVPPPIDHVEPLQGRNLVHLNSPRRNTITHVNHTNRPSPTNFEHDRSSPYRDYQHQYLENDPAIILDAPYGQSVFIDSLDYIYPHNEETGIYTTPSPRVNRREYERHHFEPILHEPAVKIPRNRPPFVVPPSETYYYKASPRSKNTSKHLETTSSTEGLDDDALTFSNKNAQVMNMRAGDSLSCGGHGESEYKTKNGRITCSCGKTMKFSVSVQGNSEEKTCKACFAEVKKDFKDLLGAYTKQGFLACECKGKVSITDLASAYMKDQRPDCNHKEDFQAVHTCSPSGDMPRTQSKTSATDVGRPPLKGCGCAKKEDSYKLPTNFVSCQCGGGGSPRMKKSPSAGRVASPHSNPPSRKSPHSNPPPSSGKKEPRSRAPRDGYPADVRYEKVTMYPAEEDETILPDPLPKPPSNEFLTRPYTQRSEKSERVTTFSESENGSTHSIAHYPSSNASSRGRKHNAKPTLKLGGRYRQRVIAYPINEIQLTAPFESNSSISYHTKKKKSKDKLDIKRDKKRNTKSEKKTKKKGDKKGDGVSVCEDSLYTMTPVSSTKLSQYMHSPSYVSSTDIFTKRRKGILHDTVNAPGIQKAGSTRLPDRKHKHTRTRSSASGN